MTDVNGSSASEEDDRLLCNDLDQFEEALEEIGEQEEEEKKKRRFRMNRRSKNRRERD